MNYGSYPGGAFNTSSKWDTCDLMETESGLTTFPMFNKTPGKYFSIIEKLQLQSPLGKWNTICSVHADSR